MRQLDLVYSTFTSLEKNYSRSKKSRAEYLREKFGGDINTGSFLILHALAQEELRDPEDIEKLSKVREIFNMIKDNQENLDALKSFDFSVKSEIEQLAEALSQAEVAGSGIQSVEQADLWKSRQAPAHFMVSPYGVRVVAIDNCKYLRLYSEPMTVLAKTMSGQNFPVGTILECKLGGRVAPVKRPGFWK